MAGDMATMTLEDMETPDASMPPEDQGETSQDQGGGVEDMADMGGVTPDMADMSGEEDMATGPCVRPDEGTNTREGQPADGWRWRKGGRVFPNLDDNFEAGDGDFAPSLIPEGEGYRLYFARRRARTFELWTATSADGSEWSEAVRVMGLEGGNYPSAVRQADGSVRLWFGSGSFDVATSTDGVAFTDQERRILTPTQVGGFAQVSMIYPEVIPSNAGDGYQMWFMGFNGQGFAIGTAYSSDGISWTPESEPVLESRSGDGYDSSAIGQPDVVRVGDRLYMWHGGYDTSNTDPGPWRVALATSGDDGATWEREGVSVALAANGDDMWSTRDPAVIRKSDGSGWLMVYVGMRDDSKYRLLTASSDACVR